MNPASMEKLVWVLIYGGLLAGTLGYFIVRQDPYDGNLLGGTLMILGAIAAAIGAVLIVVRSRLPDRRALRDEP